VAGFDRVRIALQNPIKRANTHVSCGLRHTFDHGSGNPMLARRINDLE
jgi:hypothetical protein